MKKELTAQMRIDYLIDKGSYCPYCKSTNMEGISGLEIEDSTVWGTVKCNSCKGEWRDVYTLTEVENI